MQNWPHDYDPLGNLGLSSLIAAIPISFCFLALAHLRTRWNDSSSLTFAPGFLSLKHALKN
jgi:L-lactate permease